MSFIGSVHSQNSTVISELLERFSVVLECPLSNLSSILGLLARGMDTLMFLLALTRQRGTNVHKP